MGESDSDDDDDNSDNDEEEDEQDVRGRRRAAGSKAAANAKVFLGDSHVPISASMAASSSLLNKANHIMNVPRADPPPSSTPNGRSGSRTRGSSSPAKPVKLKAPLPEFSTSTTKPAVVSIVSKVDDPITPSKRNGALMLVFNDQYLICVMCRCFLTCRREFSSSLHR